MTRIWLMLFLMAASTAGAAPPNARYSPRPRTQVQEVQVDRIEISGVELFETEAIEGALEVRIGEVLDRAKIVRTAQNLQTLYRSKGYEELAVRTELGRQRLADGSEETILRIQVKEGKPSRVVAVNFVVARAREGLAWPKVEERVRSRTVFHPGDLYDQDRVAETKREILEALAAEEYVGARILGVAERVVGPPKDLDPLPEAARWIELEYKVDVGEKVSFGFRGNTQFSLGRLAELVKAQRLAGFGEDYVSDIRKRVEDEYRNIGYAKVSVEILTFERLQERERHVTFVIKEGPRIEIEAVEFDGYSAFKPQELRTEFFDHAPNLVQRGYYVPRDTDRASELLIEWMKSEGYLSARLVTVNRSFVSDTKVRLLIYLYEGERTVLEGIDLEGLNRLKREDTLDILGVAEGRPLNLFAFTEGIEKLKTDYRNAGYLDFRVLNENTDSVVAYADENRRARIRLLFEEGPCFKVNRIEVEGNTRTNKNVVLHEVSFSEGDILREDLLNESEANLRRLGIFANVSIRTFTDAEKPDTKVVVVNVTEGTPGEWQARVGGRNDLGFRVFASVGYGNLWGRNHAIRLDGSVNYRIDQYFCRIGPCFPEYQAQLTYNWPHLFFEGLSLRPKFAVENIRYVSFDVLAQAASLTFERRFNIFSGLKHSLGAVPSLVLSLDYTLERITQSNAPIDTDNQTLRIGSITPSLKIDFRDNALAPTKGFMAQSSFEIASKYLGAQTEPYPVGYTRFQLRADGHIPFGKVAVWYLSFRSGFARNLEPPPDPNSAGQSEYTLPLSKQFVLGGAGSIRGFQERSINVNDFSIRGTLSYVNYRTQLDIPFSGNLQFGPFLDAGNLIRDGFSFGDLRWGAGVGFRYLSPVGPVNFDFGFNLFPQPNEATSQFYFSIGVI